MVLARKYSGESCCSESFIMGQLTPHMSVRASNAQSWRREITGPSRRRAAPSRRAPPRGAAPTRSGKAWGSFLNCHRGFDRRVALVSDHLEVFVLVVEDGIGSALDVERRVGEGLAAQLQFHLFAVVVVDVAVAAGPDEVAHVQVALLRHHV